MVRCSEDRSKTRYDEECVNARLAVSRIQAREEAARKVALEASSERKRDALRRQQAAAAEARRRAAEAERVRKEAEYLSQFGLQPGDAERAEPVRRTARGVSAGDRPWPRPMRVDPNPQPSLSDLESVREELKRRNEQGGD